MVKLKWCAHMPEVTRNTKLLCPYICRVEQNICRIAAENEFRECKGKQQQHSQSRILVVLPAYPICNHKVRAHGNDE